MPFQTGQAATTGLVLAYSSIAGSVWRLVDLHGKHVRGLFHVKLSCDLPGP